MNLAMNETTIIWYSIKRDGLAVEEHEAVGLDEALKIVDGYLARGGEKFYWGEDALAATMFGFQRSKSEFIEICVHGPEQISYRFEASDPNVSWFWKLFKGNFEYEEELHSREELVKKIQEFFTTPVDEIKRKLEKG